MLWGATLATMQPYIEYQQRQVMFREGVVSFFFGPKEEARQDEEAYQAAVKMRQKLNGEADGAEQPG